MFDKKKYSKEWRLKNKDKVKIHAQRTYQKNKLKRFKNMKDYYDKHKEEIIQYHKKYYKTNKEKLLNQGKLYVKNNREKYLSYQKKHYRENKQEYVDRITRAMEKDPERYFGYTLKTMKKVFELLGDDYPTIKTVYEYWTALSKWSKLVRKRDNSTCQNCGVNNTKMFAHHIFYKQYYPRLSLNLNNGITLCKKCHDEIHLKNI